MLLGTLAGLKALFTFQETRLEFHTGLTLRHVGQYGQSSHFVSLLFLFLLLFSFTRFGQKIKILEKLFFPTFFKGLQR